MRLSSYNLCNCNVQLVSWLCPHLKNAYSLWIVRWCNIFRVRHCLPWVCAYHKENMEETSHLIYFKFGKIVHNTLSYSVSNLIEMYFHFGGSRNSGRCNYILSVLIGVNLCQVARLKYRRLKCWWFDSGQRALVAKDKLWQGLLSGPRFDTSVRKVDLHFGIDTIFELTRVGRARVGFILSPGV